MGSSAEGPAVARTREPENLRTRELRRSRLAAGLLALGRLRRLLAVACALRASTDWAPNRFVNRSDAALGVDQLLRPVKNGWQALQISRCSSGFVDLVLNVVAAGAPHLDVVVFRMDSRLHCELLGVRRKRKVYTTVSSPGPHPSEARVQLASSLHASTTSPPHEPSNLRTRGTFGPTTSPRKFCPTCGP
jgi:hypothetical protein